MLTAAFSLNCEHTPLNPGVGILSQCHTHDIVSSCPQSLSVPDTLTLLYPAVDSLSHCQTHVVMSSCLQSLSVSGSLMSLSPAAGSLSHCQTHSRRCLQLPTVSLSKLNTHVVVSRCRQSRTGSATLLRWPVLRRSDIVRIQFHRIIWLAQSV